MNNFVIRVFCVFPQRCFGPFKNASEAHEHLLRKGWEIQKGFLNPPLGLGHYEARGSKQLALIEPITIVETPEELPEK